MVEIVLPRAVGSDGTDGVDGASATIAVGTVTTGAPGSSATVSNVGTASAAVFDFSIPRGADGSGSGDVVGPGGVTADSLAQFDGATGKMLKGGPLLGVGAAGSVLRRSDGDGRYRLAATALTIADTTGLQGALDNKQPLATGLTALAGLSTAGLYYLSAPGVWSSVTIGSGLTFTTGTLSATGGGGSGDVVGPASATADAPAVFNGTTGKLIKVGAFPVLSVAGLTGAITGAGLKTALSLVKGDVGLGNVDNTSDASKPVSTAQQTALNLKANINDTIVSVTTSRDLAASDNGKVLEVNSASAVTLTVPSTLAALFNCIVSQIGAGQVTVAAGAGASVNAFGGAKTAGQWAELSVRVRASAGAAVVSGGVA